MNLKHTISIFYFFIFNPNFCQNSSKLPRRSAWQSEIATILWCWKSYLVFGVFKKHFNTSFAIFRTGFIFILQSFHITQQCRVTLTLEAVIKLLPESCKMAFIQMDIYTNAHCTWKWNLVFFELIRRFIVLWMGWNSLFQNLILVLDPSLLQFFSAKSQLILWQGWVFSLFHSVQQHRGSKSKLKTLRALQQYMSVDIY